MLTTQYLKQQEEYTDKYGDKTVVLMQIGSFYEIHEFSPEKCAETYAWPQKKIGHVTEVSSLLNMVATRKDKKKPYSLTNCALAGFPVISYEKHRDVLLANNYTIVKIDQKKDGKDIERYVSEILSPATNLENISALPVTNNIVSLYIEVMKEDAAFENYILTVGLSCIDVTTGENSVFEIYSKEKDAIYALHEIHRYLNSIRPRELLLTLNQKNPNKYSEFLISTLELSKIEVFVLNKLNPDFLKLDFCTHFLSNIFSVDKIKYNPHIVEDLTLERVYYGCVSYVILLNYCQEHNATLVEKLTNPNTSWLDEDKYLTLTHNAATQLDLLPSKDVKKHNRSNKNIDSLLSVVNYTKTSLGKRYLISRLTHPITDVKSLEETYNIIEDLISRDSLLFELRTLLKEVPDLERYQRKLYLKLIQPKEFSILFSGYIQIASIYTQIYNSKSKLYSLLFPSAAFNTCLQGVIKKYNLDVLANSKLENGKLDTLGETLFYTGQDTKFDKYCTEIKRLKDKIETIVETLNSYLESTKGKKIVYTSDAKKNLGLWTTAHKAKVLEKSSYPVEVVGHLQFVPTNKDVMITSTIIAETCNNYINLSEEMSQYLYASYNVTLNEICEYKFFPVLNGFISRLDFLCSASYGAIQNKYFKPQIEERENSYLEIKDLRHPIVECLILDSYVTNDLSLGGIEKGILLYGQNSSGKSTLGKAVALNVILAQAGLYTACQLKYYPYQKIITRLSGHDSVMTGESSFIVEMKELRTILRNANARTLVLADEIARGTESVSATSLSVASICHLVQAKTSFIFSTHLHNLVEMKDIKNMGTKLKICHLSLRYDGNILIYDRKLKTGSGDSIYGLEVANSLGLDSEFMTKAYEIRREMEGLFVKKSRYNSKVYLDTCFLCGGNKDLETHHIEEQQKSDKRGFIDTFHKNIPSNLIGICNGCHDALHSKGLSIIREETSQGSSLSLI